MTHLTRNAAGNESSLSGLGGAAFQCVLMACNIHSNRAWRGAGIFESSAYDTCISANYGRGGGAGAADSDLVRCVVSNNVFRYVGSGDGCGMSGGRAFNTLIIQNDSDHRFARGAGAARALLLNCTVVSNVTRGSGGGVYDVVMSNTIVYYNDAATGTNWAGTNVAWNCCTWPMPTSGMGNTTNEPRFVCMASNDVRLSADSPCIAAGLAAPWMLPPDPRSTDLDGQSRLAYGAPDIGAYEFVAGLWCDFTASPTEVIVADTVWFYSMVAGTNHTALWYQWDFGDESGSGLAGDECSTAPWRYDTLGTKTILCVVCNAAAEVAVSTRTNYVYIIPEPAGAAVCMLCIVLARRARVASSTKDDHR